MNWEVWIMKSRTSYSKLTSFRKDITRFAPLWAIYFIGGLLVMLTACGDIKAGGTAWALAGTLPGMTVVNLVYASLCANLLFGDLFNSRLCNAMHAMPMRREHWFFSHVAAGFCFSIVPHAAAMLVMMTYLKQFWYVALLWMAVMGLEFLFFFGIAVLSCMCTGSRFAMVVVDGLINFFSMIALWFCGTVYFPLLYGVEPPTKLFYDFCPTVRLTGAGRDAFVVIKKEYSSIAGRSYHYEGLGDGWGYLAVLAVLGVAALAAALLLYRRRKLESAGDFIAVKALKPVFLTVYTLCAGAVFALFGQLFGNSYLGYLIVGMVIGFFTGQMLLRRTIRVFQVKRFVSCGILAAVILLSAAVVKWDPMGIVDWVPDVRKVESVDVSCAGNNGTCSGELVEEVIALHRDALAEPRTEETDRYYSLEIVYKLTDGRSVTRNYTITEKLMTQHAGLLSCAEMVFGKTEEQLRQTVSTITLMTDTWEVLLYGEDMCELLEAVLADCREGHMAQFWREVDKEEGKYPTTTAYNLSLGNRFLTVFPDSVNTLRWVEQYLKAHPDLGTVPQ